MHVSNVMRCGAALLFIQVAAAPAAAPPAGIPFAGVEQGTNFERSFEFPILTIGIESAGIATTGRYTGDGQLVVNVLTSEVLESSITLTSAGGAQLFVDLDATEISPTELHVLGTITGGSGRFEGASGEYDFWLTYAEPSGTLPNTYTAHFRGFISR